MTWSIGGVSLMLGVVALAFISEGNAVSVLCGAIALVLGAAAVYLGTCRYTVSDVGIEHHRLWGNPSAIQWDDVSAIKMTHGQLTIHSEDGRRLTVRHLVSGQGTLADTILTRVRTVAIDSQPGLRATLTTMRDR
jgi:hypothetical protein